MNHLEIKHLRMILAIADTGNMTRASKKLFISQSALSQQLKDIEGKLGVDLFFRTPRKMILTEAGKKIRQTAGRVIEALSDTELEIAKVVNGDQGELKVGTECIFCYQWLPRVIGLLHERFPKVELALGNSVDWVTDLESKKFDLIITAVPGDDDRFAHSPLFEDQLVCIMPIDHPLSSRSWVDLEDFGRFNLITHDEKKESKVNRLLLKPRGIEPKGFMMINQPQAIIEMVAGGYGLSVFPRWAVKSALQTHPVVYRPLTREGIPLKWHAVYLQNSKMPLYQEEFIRVVGKLNIPRPLDLKEGTRKEIP